MVYHVQAHADAGSRGAHGVGERTLKGVKGGRFLAGRAGIGEKHSALQPFIFNRNLGNGGEGRGFLSSAPALLGVLDFTFISNYIVTSLSILTCF